MTRDRLISFILLQRKQIAISNVNDDWLSMIPASQMSRGIRANRNFWNKVELTVRESWTEDDFGETQKSDKKSDRVFARTDFRKNVNHHQFNRMDNQEPNCNPSPNTVTNFFLFYLVFHSFKLVVILLFWCLFY